jgi:predicted membrane metal-binding protein
VLRRVDLFALAAAVLAGALTVMYVFLVHSQGNRPAWWAVGILSVAVLGAAYGVRLRAPYRLYPLVVASVGLFLLGFLALFSIGLPLMLAAVLCVVAALRTPTRDWRDTV